MVIKDDPDLEDALDGLQHAEMYAEEIGDMYLAQIIATCYQILGRVSPEAHWDEIDDPEAFVEELVDDE